MHAFGPHAGPRSAGHVLMIEEVMMSAAIAPFIWFAQAAGKLCESLVFSG